MNIIYNPHYCSSVKLANGKIKEKLLLALNVKF